MTDEQRAAVQTESSDTLVVAGAGSGKTRVLVERVRMLLHHGVPPSEIALLTFTRQAAWEMRERLEAEDNPDFRDMYIGTFHALAYWIVRTDGHVVDIDTSRLMVLDEDTAKFLFKEQARKLGLIKKGRYCRRFTAAKLDDAYQKLSREHSCYEWVERYDDDQMQICQMYRYTMRVNSLVDMPMLMQMAVYICWQSSNWSDRFSHVLVDECQDTTSLEDSLVTLLSEVSATTYRVGDPRQMIYRWRGASPVFEDHDRVYQLTKSFRCDARIAAVANRLMGHLSYKPVESATGKSGSAGVAAFPKDGIVDWLHHLRASEDWEWSSFAVLVRRNQDALNVAEELREAGIPVHISETCANRAHGRRSDFVRAISHLYAMMQYPMPFDGTESPEDTPPSLGPDAPMAKALAWFNEHKNEYSELYRAAVDGVWSRYHDFTVRDALVHYAFRDSQDFLEDEIPNAVYVGTVHSAKGLEWDAVIVDGFVEGVFPTARSVAEGADPHLLEDERRLAYVAMTRARHRLLLMPSVPLDREQEVVPSRFIAEALGEGGQSK